MNVPPQKPQGRTFVVVQLNIRYEKELGKEKALLISLMIMLVQAIISSFLRSFSHLTSTIHRFQYSCLRFSTILLSHPWWNEFFSLTSESSRHLLPNAAFTPCRNYRNSEMTTRDILLIAFHVVGLSSAKMNLAAVTWYICHWSKS